ncbi:MAG: xanthine dehydrogenase family protein molybdopterin-binding subunit [Chloroflexi bacterium]|nr:xanthine dehydrogenase family protein molybdopterin-binding subunit [Chloroflexota bacterium]
MVDYQPNAVLVNEEFNVVGTRPIRHDGLDKVTGRARFGADVHMPGMLHGRILRSPHPHAVIKSIDYSRALAHPGVKAVVTAADFPDSSAEFVDQEEGAATNYGFYSRNIMAREKALYKGHAVAALAATDPHLAEEALSLIDVEYEVLPPVMNAFDAMKSDAPILHERLLTMTSPAFRAGAWGDTQSPTNVSNHFEFRSGDIEEGFRQADVVIERQYHTKAVHQGYIEPHASTAFWNSDGYVTIWCSTQQLFAFRDHTSIMLGIPVSRIKVVPMEIGGGFGGKGMSGLYLEPVVSLLSKKAAAPVKIAMTRTEVFEGTGPTSATHTKVKIGATSDGKMTAVQAELVYEAGAFPGSPVPTGCRTMFAAYTISNALIEGYDVVVNTQKSAAYRAPGSPAAAFAAESAIDELAEKLGIDPIEIRLINGAKEGTRQPTGPVFNKIGNIETLEAGRGHAHYNTRMGEAETGKLRGRGVASGAWFNGSGPASAVASVNPDGTISLIEGSPDIGGSRTVMAQHVAEVLGIPVETIKPSIVDTDSIGYCSGAGGSGVTFKTGRACYEAAQDVKCQMIERAAFIWDVKPDDVEYDNGTLRHRSDSELSITFQALAPRLNGTGGPIVGRATVNPGGVGNAFALHIVDVEVDSETGKVEILRYTAIQDVGKAIHPGYVEGQLQGGAVQGIGWALNEEYYFNDEGKLMNPTFLDYRMPTSLDLPMIDTVIVEVANPGHPFGVRGVGEACIVPPMAAIANAVSHAIGTRMSELPMTPAKIVAAMGSGSV